MINVLYEDNHIIVVEKPIGVLSQEDNTKDKDLLTMTKKYLKDKYNKPGNVYLGLVHRLDRMVGGVMVFARTSKAASRLSESIRNKELKKEYLAIVKGKVKDKEKLIDHIKRLDNGNSIIDDTGAEAILEYELIDYNEENDCSLVKINLITGRHHQIRVQFAHRNHPILGDHRYSDTKDKLPIALYAYYLEFIHPVKKVTINFKKMPENTGYWKLFDLNKLNI